MPWQDWHLGFGASEDWWLVSAADFCGQPTLHLTHHRLPCIPKPKQPIDPHVPTFLENSALTEVLVCSFLFILLSKKFGSAPAKPTQQNWHPKTQKTQNNLCDIKQMKLSIQIINACKLQDATCAIMSWASTCAAGHKWYSGHYPKKHLHLKENNSMPCFTSTYNKVYVLLVCNYLIRCTCTFWCVLCKLALLFAIDHSA